MLGVALLRARELSLRWTQRIFVRTPITENMSQAMASFFAVTSTAYSIGDT
jgi:hypothetical protein